MSVPTVHIVDDDGAIREALDSLFRSVGLETRLFGNAQDFFRSGHAHDAGCLVLDVRLPGVSGLDFQAQLNAADIRMPVVLMTGHGDIPMTVRGMKAGAVDFLAKPFRDQDMLDAVTAAIGRDQAQRAERSGLDEARRRYDTLTARERQVMAMVAAGLMNKQIAFEIGLSEITVKIHRGSAMRKMEARSMLEFVRMAELLGVAPAT
ncbi:DNA-binding response regulator [Caulobacter sp. D4A]|uniref:response regulator transcription factor n=1 Tax=unclassified Caulobacter TaxID=2648921 RepID=UPI000D731074|nr:MULTISPECIES: response regulator [unclassified Caulobacter]PXA76761.1 DNA-binding response regulator [Caulobacter sp. D4A]PXA88965.1 DNA-binding response regulator [Caulobacter sp. D5]